MHAQPFSSKNRPFSLFSGFIFKVPGYGICPKQNFIQEKLPHGYALINRKTSYEWTKPAIFLSVLHN